MKQFTLACLVLMVTLCAPMSTHAQQEPDREKSPPAHSKTDNRILEGFIKKLAGELEGTGGRWTFHVDGVPMLAITDQAANRMRIIAAVAESADLSESDLRSMLEANFDRALDAKYSIWKGTVWASFVHPLAELTQAEFESAAKQVAALKENYGTTYSSSELVFSGGDGN